MTLRERLRASAIIAELAKQEGISPAEVRRSIERSISEAWSNKTSDSAEMWSKFFPDGKKPGVEKFIVTLGRELRKDVSEGSI